MRIAGRWQHLQNKRAADTKQELPQVMQGAGHLGKVTQFHAYNIVAHLLDQGKVKEHLLYDG